MPHGAIGVTLSLGVAVMEGLQPPEAKALLLAADTAHYQAKANGRNQVEVAGCDSSSVPPFSSSIPRRKAAAAVGGV